MSNQHTITDADDGIRLDRWFKRHQPGMPHSLLEKSLRKGDIRLDGKKAKASQRVGAGQVIEMRIQDSGFRIQAGKNASLNPDDVKMMQNAVLYKDANIIIINKPAGIAVQGGTKISRSIDGMLGALAEGGERPKLVHRLDRDTSGCLVLARNTKTAAALMPLFAGRRVKKIYLALVNNLPEPLSGTIDLPILKKENPKAEAYAKGLAAPKRSEGGRDYEIMQVDDAGQKAVTEYSVVDTLARKFALVEMAPLTGRTHQLRVHMAAIGCPIVGDHKYGGSMDAARSLGVENVLHLHARRILLPPLGGHKAVDVKAPLPKHMRESFKALGLDVPK